MLNLKTGTGKGAPIFLIYRPSHGLMENIGPLLIQLPNC